MRILAAFLLCLSLAACGDPMDKPLTVETLTELNENDVLTEEQKTDLAAYMMRSSFATAMAATRAGEEVDETALDQPNVTVGEALERQRQFREEEEARVAAERERAEAERAAREAELERLRGIVRVTAVSKSKREARFSTYSRFEYLYENTSDQDITGFKGMLVVNDMFGDHIKNLIIKHDERIAAGGRTTYTASYDINEFISDNVKLLNTPLDKMQIEWQPEMIVFADGETVQISE